MQGSRILWSDLIVHGLVDQLHPIVEAGFLGESTRTFKDYSASIRRIEMRAFKNDNKDVDDNKVVRS